MIIEPLKYWQNEIKRNIIFFVSLNPITPDGVSQRHTLHLIASHFYMNEENEVSFHEFLS